MARRVSSVSAWRCASTSLEGVSAESSVDAAAPSNLLSTRLPSTRRTRRVVGMSKRHFVQGSPIVARNFALLRGGASSTNSHQFSTSPPSILPMSVTETLSRARAIHLFEASKIRKTEVTPRRPCAHAKRGDSSIPYSCQATSHRGPETRVDQGYNFPGGSVLAVFGVGASETYSRYVSIPTRSQFAPRLLSGVRLRSIRNAFSSCGRNGIWRIRRITFKFAGSDCEHFLRPLT